MLKFLRHKTWIKTYLFFILFVGIVLWYFFIRVPDYQLEQLRIYLDEEAYKQDMIEMVGEFQNITSKPKVYVMIPPAMY